MFYILNYLIILFSFGNGTYVPVAETYADCCKYIGVKITLLKIKTLCLCLFSLKRNWWTTWNFITSKVASTRIQRNYCSDTYMSNLKNVFTELHAHGKYNIFFK